MSKPVLAGKQPQIKLNVEEQIGNDYTSVLLYFQNRMAEEKLKCKKPFPITVEEKQHIESEFLKNYPKYKWMLEAKEKRENVQWECYELHYKYMKTCPSYKTVIDELDLSSFIDRTAPFPVVNGNPIQKKSKSNNQEQQQDPFVPFKAKFTVLPKEIHNLNSSSTAFIYGEDDKLISFEMTPRENADIDFFDSGNYQFSCTFKPGKMNSIKEIIHSSKMPVNPIRTSIPMMIEKPETGYYIINLLIEFKTKNGVTYFDTISTPEFYILYN